MKILVTGGAGYIGSHTCKELYRAGYQVFVLDNLSTGYAKAVKWGELLQGDVGDEEFLAKVFSSHKFEGVLHFAGSIVVPESVTDPLKYYQNNTANSLKLINACLKFNIPHFIFSSTAAVYGIPESLKVDENSPTAPINPYGMSKLMTEFMLRDVAKAYEDKFRYVALRYFNVSGADPDGEIGQAFEGATHLIKVNCEAAANKRDKTYIYGDKFLTRDGTGERDYIHVSDLAQAHVAALDYLVQGGVSNIFNCGYGIGFTVKEVVTAVKKVTGKEYPVIISDARPGDPPSLVAQTNKILQHLNWKPQFQDLELIIKHAFDWEQSKEFLSWNKN
jgi:UDP-glucose 4-epimerase